MTTDVLNVLIKGFQMNVVEPIRDIEKIEEIKDVLLEKSYKNYMIFLVGINTGLRIGDLLKLKVEDVRNIKHIYIKEQKTSKVKRFLINTALRKELDKYMKDMTKDNTRKTFGYHHYKKYKDIALLQKLYNHSKPSITLDYIGITQDMIDNSIEKFSL